MWPIEIFRLKIFIWRLKELYRDINCVNSVLNSQVEDSIESFPNSLV